MASDTLSLRAQDPKDSPASIILAQHRPRFAPHLGKSVLSRGRRHADLSMFNSPWP